MFKIVSPTKALVKFIMMLKLNLTEPQTRHEKFWLSVFRVPF